MIVKHTTTRAQLDADNYKSISVNREGDIPKDYDFESKKELVPMQPGDVPITYADTSALEKEFNFKPDTSLREGLHNFAVWYKDFYMKEGK